MSTINIYGIQQTRTCTQCGTTQPNNRNHFGSQNGGTGVKNRCRQCERDNSKKSHRNKPYLMKARAIKSKQNRGIQSWSGTPQLARLIKCQGNICTYCRHHMDDPTVDHRMPVSRGGTDEESNLAACCRRCNSNKRDKTEDEYREFLRRVGHY